MPRSLVGLLFVNPLVCNIEGWANNWYSHLVADILALGTVTSVGNCGGPRIPYHGGRVDATGPGPSGVPEPDTDLQTTLSYFANAGFNQADSIMLTAYGHTLGSVHHGGFPSVMDNSTVGPDNTQGAGHLDATNAAFDIDVVNEYLEGNGQRGGPLVTSFNESSRSDLRLYTSDDNATMTVLAGSGTEGFSDTCVDLLKRMINTVPSTVQLTDAIEPIEMKPVNVTFDINEAGALTLKGVVRVCPFSFRWISRSHENSVQLTNTPVPEQSTQSYPVINSCLRRLGLPDQYRTLCSRFQHVWYHVILSFLSQFFFLVY